MTNSRITLARLHRGWTKKRLAESVGVTPAAMTKIEKGDISPSPETLGKVADALGFPLSFFDLPPVEIPPADAISFRSLRKMTRSQRDQAISWSAFGADLSDWMDGEFNLPSVDVPDLSELDPAGAASALRGVWGLGEHPVANMISLLEAHGIRVFSLQETAPTVDAYSFWDEDRDRPFVFLTTAKSAERRRMDAAHELGHLVLHRKVDLVEGHRELEREANEFASALLMPPAGFSATVPRYPALSDFMAVKRHWKVSLAAAVYRAHALGLVSDWQYRDLFRDISSRGFRRREPDGIPPERSEVARQVIDLESDGARGTRTISSKTGIPEALVASLTFVIPGNVIEGGGRRSTGERHTSPPSLRVV